ncbi:hypothetical protein [Alicyclobacillus sp. SO9]|uniref:hypothetical protein n=1 Tax=Alicyclobacillus sp. SO9 TaxID=2665646 RepID=UPI0018E7A1AC|nr:hypothetical protein [Alicyclobacillus sp. SO9]QQE78382.1 hypothetical protein GI364_21305 [Alicyclobacillus sp. SO9]
MSSPEPVRLPITYNKWNDALFDYFFATASHKIIYLYTNERTIIQIGQKLGLPEDECLPSFTYCVRSYVNDIAQLFRLTHHRGMKWYRQGAVGHPPFLAVLALTVLAATKMESDAEEHIGGGNYYHRLRELLETADRSGMPLGFKDCMQLWDILLAWQKGNDGQYGFTFSFTFSSIPYCGYPRSQCLIRDTERGLLNEFFIWAQYESDSELEHDSVKANLEEYLSARSCRLSRWFFHNTKGIKEAIVHMAIEELKNWEPEYEPDLLQTSRKNIPLSLLIELGNMFSREARFSLISAPVLTEDKTQNLADGLQFRNGYYLYESPSPKEIAEGLFLNTETQKLAYKGSEVIVFRKGNDVGLGGWLSRKDMLPEHEHLILYTCHEASTIEGWINTNSFSKVSKISAGVPDGWQLTKLKLSRDIILTDDFRAYGIKSRTDHVTVAFQGGLKIKHNCWLYNYPPALSVVAPPKSTISIDGREILCLTDGSTLVRCDHYLQEPGVHHIAISDKSYTMYISMPEETTFTQLSHRPYHRFTVNPGVSVDISGTYLLHDPLALPSPLVQNGPKEVILTGEGRLVARYPEESIMRCGPYIRSIDHIENIESVRGVSPLPLRPIDHLIDYLALKREGNWDSFLNALELCLGQSDGLTAYKVRRFFSDLGIVEFVSEARYTNRFKWRALPPTCAVLPLADCAVILTGTRPRSFISFLRSEAQNIQLRWHIPQSDFQPTTFYLVADQMDELFGFLFTRQVAFNHSEEYFSYDLIRSLPTLGEFLNASLDGMEPFNPISFEGWNTIFHRWEPETRSELTRYNLGYGRKLHLLKLSSRTVQVSPEVGKLYAASVHNQRIFSYSNYRLSVRKEYLLPELYSRALVLCSGSSPKTTFGKTIYRNIPGELALITAFRLGFEL